MNDILERVKKYTAKHQMISEGDIVAAGVSGGADSVCMLHMLRELSKELDFRLLAVHVHHGMRADADADAEYVGQLCREWDIPFYLKKVDMAGYAGEKGLSPEEAGRKLRYLAFEEILAAEQAKACRSAEEDSFRTQDKSIYKIAVAHNNNDKAETMLFHLFRGSGLRGLGSIRPVRGQVIRPLLCLDRAEIEAYLNEKKIVFCSDSTNDEDTYTRNKIRHHIIPYAEEQICRNAAAHIGDAADILAETGDFVEKQARRAFEKCLVRQEVQSGNVSEEENGSLILDLAVLRDEDIFLQKMVLMHCMELLTPYRKDITKEHINALLNITDKGGSKELALPYGLTAYKEYDRLILYRKKENLNIPGVSDPNMDKQEFLPIPVSVPGEVTVPGLGVLEFCFIQKEDFFYKKDQIIPEKTYTKWFDYDKITTVLLLRTRKTGDYLTIDSNLRKKSVKEYMTNEKIPKIRRERIYLLADGAHILWIPGYRISQYYKVDESTECILQVRLRGGQ